MKKLVSLLICLTLLFLPGCTTSQNSDGLNQSPSADPVPLDTPVAEETPTPTPEPTPVVIPEPVSYTGSGDDVISIAPPEGVYVFRISGNTDARHFAVKGYDTTGNSTELLVNTTEPYSGITLDPTQSTSTLEVSAEGDWLIELVSILEMPTISEGQTVTGAGDSVLLVSSYGTTATISGNSSSAHFAVKSYGTSRDNLMVNTTDQYEGTVMIKGDPLILTVNCEDEWSITF